MKIAAFIIHLDRAVQRRRQVDRIIAACPVKARILDAVDGKAMSEAEIEQVYKLEKLFEPRYPFRIGPGEIGCFLSHRNAWRQIIDDGLDAGLIIEDDVEIERAVFARAYKLSTQHLATFGYIQFQVRPLPPDSRVVAIGGSCKLIEPQIVPLRTSAQLVSRQAAERLLEITSTFDRPVDGLLQMTWVTGIRIVCAAPSGVHDRTVETGGSTISPARESLRQRIFKEASRWRYRRAIAAYSRRQAKRS